MAIGTFISIIPLNVTKPKDTDWLNGYKNKTHIYVVYKKKHFRPEDTYRPKVRGWKNIFHARGKQKKLEYQSSYQTK